MYRKILRTPQRLLRDIGLQLRCLSALPTVRRHCRLQMPPPLPANFVTPSREARLRAHRRTCASCPSPSPLRPLDHELCFCADTQHSDVSDVPCGTERGCSRHPSQLHARHPTIGRREVLRLESRKDVRGGAESVISCCRVASRMASLSHKAQDSGACSTREEKEACAT